MDDTTASTERGQFVRLSVEIDLHKRLLSKFRMNRRIWKIRYEGLKMICFKCGKYGHREEECDLFNIAYGDTLTTQLQNTLLILVRQELRNKCKMASMVLG